MDAANFEAIEQTVLRTGVGVTAPVASQCSILDLPPVIAFHVSSLLSHYCGPYKAAFASGGHRTRAPHR